MSKRSRRGVPGFNWSFLGRWQTVMALAICVVTVLSLRGRSQPQSARAPEPWMETAPTSTGPALGEKIPLFRAPDQQGRMQDFNSIRGPKGAVIAFNRSADW